MVARSAEHLVDRPGFDDPAGIHHREPVGDLDRPEDGVGNFGNFRHEQWWAGAPHTRTQKNNFGTLRLQGTQRKP